MQCAAQSGPDFIPFVKPKFYSTVEWRKRVCILSYTFKRVYGIDNIDDIDIYCKSRKNFRNCKNILLE